MYCKRCGMKIPETDNFCPNCGEPVGLTHVNRRPSPAAPVVMPEETFLGSVTAVLFGLSMIGGGIYSAVEWTEYTKWAIPGGLSAVLAGASCMVQGICQLHRIMKTKGNNEDEQ